MAASSRVVAPTLQRPSGGAAPPPNAARPGKAFSSRRHTRPAYPVAQVASSRPACDVSGRCGMPCPAAKRQEGRKVCDVAGP